MHHDRNHRAPVHTLSQQLDTRFDPDLGAIWLDMQSAPRPCFTPRLLEELRRYQRMLENRQGHWRHAGAMRRVDYQVLTSSVPGIFNLGGDLDRFLGWITERDRGALASYARACIDVLYPNAVNYHLPITTIALVRGQAPARDPVQPVPRHGRLQPAVPSRHPAPGRADDPRRADLPGGGVA
jgi:DSF synthase